VWPRAIFLSSPDFENIDAIDTRLTADRVFDRQRNALANPRPVLLIAAITSYDSLAFRRRQTAL
jgi:hypothetical protein